MLFPMKEINSEVVIVVFLFTLTNIKGVEYPRPRGVSLSRAALYNPERNFVCFDNSKTIPFTQVNDDYCDCEDGSDEPGTSACPFGLFHCPNAGHKPLTLSSNRVNDGICDCCDGTDENNNNCPNVCLELGKHAREKAQQFAEIVKAGNELKVELSQRGIKQKQERKEKLIELQKSREEAEKVKAEKQTLKEEIEKHEEKALEHYRKIEEEEQKLRGEEEALKDREEAVETFQRFDLDQDGIVDIVELQTRQSFDKDKNGEVSIEEAKYFLGNLDSVTLETFIETAWPNIKPYLLVDTEMYKPSGEAEDLHPHEEEAEHNEEEEGEEEEEEPEHAEEEQIQEPEQKYDEDTQKLIDQAVAARTTFTEAERNVRDIESEIKEIEEYLQKDFGPDEEFAVLQGECFELTDHEYLYKLCPFDRTTQQPKSGSSETRLGSWGSWAGPEDDKYQVMLYDRGQSCWNGPQRSTKVHIVCGVDNRVISVSEPNKCEYRFEFSTPAACREITSDNNDELHDEL